MPSSLRLLLLSALTASALAQPYRTTPIQITADLSEAPRKLYHAEIDIPVTPGPITLTTPKWIPGNHRPTGPVDEITGVVFTAAGAVLPWRRDDVNLYEFHVTIPKGFTTLHAHLDCIVPARVSQKLAVLEWEKLLLYPTGLAGRDIKVQPTVIVPAGWGVGTALQPLGPVANATNSALPGSTTRFAPTTVEQLEDSPVITGQYFHEFPLAPDVTPKHFIDVVADQPEDSQLRPQLLAELNNLVHETGAAYNSRHYNTYHFLLTLSDVAGGEGLEHGQSSDNGVGEKGFATQGGSADLLPHEFTHSWNGKYRRPARLYQPNFFEPEQGDLLWVYEGMTQYMGNVLAARSGLKSQAQYRDSLATSAANLDMKPGRTWRNTEDTAIAASILRGGDQGWSNWKRGQDYYQEGELLWLDVDTTIRKMTGNKKSILDFHHIFLGKGGNTGPLIVPYEFNELVTDLNQVVKNDWSTFLKTRITTLDPHANTKGIEAGGYRLVYLDHQPPSDRTAGADAPAARGGRMGPNVWYSLGLRLNAEGAITDVRVYSAADKAKLAPGQKILGINGQIYTNPGLTAAILAAKGKTEPIHLIVQADTFLTMVDLPYFDGDKFPALERIEGTPALLDDITKPLTPPDPASISKPRDRQVASD